MLRACDHHLQVRRPDPGPLLVMLEDEGLYLQQVLGPLVDFLGAELHLAQGVPPVFQMKDDIGSQTMPAAIRCIPLKRFAVFCYSNLLYFIIEICDCIQSYRLSN